MQPELKKEASIGYAIHEVARLFRRRFEDEAKVHGLTLPQWRALAEIHRNDAISQVALAALIDTDPMTLSGVLDRLEKRGLIERFADPADSRAKLAKLRPAGVELVMMARNVGRQVYEHAMQGVSEHDRKVLASSLTCIRDNLLNLPADLKEEA
ncbi:MAG: MarR family transcriptional regulator [Devosia sp.]